MGATAVMEITLHTLCMIHLPNPKLLLPLLMVNKTLNTTRLPTVRLVLNGTRQNPPTAKSRTMKTSLRLTNGVKSLHRTGDPRVLLNTHLMPMPTLSLVRITLPLPLPLRSQAALMMYTPCRHMDISTKTKLNLLLNNKNNKMFLYV